MGDVRRARQLPSRMVPPPSCSTQHVRGPTGGAAGRGRVPTRHTRLDLSYCRRTSLSLLPSPGICLGCPTPPITNLRVPRPRGQPHLLLGVDNSPQEEFHPLSFAASLGSSSLGKSEEHVCGCPKLLRNSVDAGSPWTGSGLSPDPGPTGGSWGVICLLPAVGGCKAERPPSALECAASAMVSGGQSRGFCSSFQKCEGNDKL